MDDTDGGQMKLWRAIKAHYRVWRAHRITKFWVEEWLLDQGWADELWEEVGEQKPPIGWHVYPMYEYNKVMIRFTYSSRKDGLWEKTADWHFPVYDVLDSRRTQAVVFSACDSLLCKMGLASKV